MRTALVILILGIALAVPARAGNVALGVPFELAIGEIVVIGDQPLLFELEGVPADSRCPRSVVCVWEGEATVQIRLEIPGETVASELLHSSGSPLGSNEIEFHDQLVRLLEVQPYPSGPGSIDPTDYRVSFVVVSLAQGAPVEPSGWSALKQLYR